jgi:hypothetical protein
VNRIARFASIVATAGILIVAGTGSASAAQGSSPEYQGPAHVAASAPQGGFITFADYIESIYPGLCDEGIAILADAAHVTPDARLRLRGGSGNGTLSVGSLDMDAIQATYFYALMACPPPI